MRKNKKMEGLLNGIRVLDFGQYIACPFCGMLLADMGAEVIKIERVEFGEEGRHLGPFKDGVSMYVTAFNRNKKGITLNLQSEKGKEMLCELIKSADVIIENFRPGVMKKMGFGYDTVKEINSRIIMASISGFGQNSRYSRRTCMDGIASAMGGLHAINYTKTGPRPTGLPLGDHIAGVYNALAVMMALYDRGQTGQGQYIDTAMVDCIFSFFETRLPTFGINEVDIGVVPKYDTGDPLCCPSNVYECKDGEWICIHAGSDANYKRFAMVTGDPKLMNEKYFIHLNRMANYEALDRLTADWFKTVTCEVADKIVSDAGVPISIVYNFKRMMKDPNSKERELIVWTDVPGIGQVPYCGNPLKLKTRPINNRNRAPLLGEHNREVYKNLLKYSEKQLLALQEEGII